MAEKPAWMPAGIGASPKKLAFLGVLGVTLGYTAWVNLRSDSPDTPSAPTAAPVQASVPALKNLPAAVPDSSSGPMPARRTSVRNGGGRNVEDFHPTLKVPEDLDVSKIDPTLRTELLDKVRQVAMVGGSRSLFEFSKPPEPPAPRVTINPGPVPPPPVAAKPVNTEPPKPPGPPPPPPIPLKYYGYAKPSGDGKLRGMFLEGDAATGDFFIAAENELVKNRYKVIRIGVRVAELEDTTNSNRESKQLVEEQSP